MTRTFRFQPIYLAFLVPFLMVAAVAAIIFLPPLFFKPGHDFLYTSNSYYYGAPAYQVDSTGHVQKLAQPTPPYYMDPTTVAPVDTPIYRYSVAADTSTQLTLDQAQQITLVSGTTSPDGYRVTDPGYGAANFIFGGPRDYNARYLVGHGTSRRLDIQNNSTYGSPVEVIGWVK